MKKQIFVLLFLVSPLFLFAQVYTNRDKMLINERIDSLLQNYMAKSGLTLPGGTKYNPKVVADLRELYTTDAEIFDDINASFNDKKGAYELITKSRNTYIEDLVDSFPAGLIITNKRVNINYDNFDKGEITVALERNIQGTTSGNFVFYNDDTLMIKIGIQPTKRVKITGVTSIGSNFRCINDDDADGVLDNHDRCRKKHGLRTLEGCPDDDVDGFPNDRDACPDKYSLKNGGCPDNTFSYRYVFSAAIGAQFNGNFLKMPELNTLGYKNLQIQDSKEVKLSDKGKIKAEHSLSLSPTFGAEFTYYVGKTVNKRNRGISIGIFSTKYDSRYKITEPAVYFYESSDDLVMANGVTSKGNSYWRTVNVHKGSYEDLKFTILSIPILFHYRAMFSPDWAFEISGGPSVISFINQSAYSITYDFNTHGQIDSASELYYINPGTLDINSSYYFAITDTNVGDSHLFGQNVDVYMENMLDAIGGPNHTGGYDVANDTLIQNSSKEKISARLTWALNANVNLLYHIKPTVAIKLGFNLTYAPRLVHKNNGYKMIDQISDKYEPIYNSTSKNQYLSFGVNTGLVVGIKSKSKK